MNKKSIFLICVLLIGLVNAGDFVVRNESDSTDIYFVVNGTTGNVGIGKIYKDVISNNIDMFPSDSSGSLDDFFLIDSPDVNLPIYFKLSRGYT